MLRKLFAVFGALLFASVILIISILRTAAVKYDFTQYPNTSYEDVSSQGSKVDYRLANPGSVLPDSPLWVAKVSRDKIWYIITTNNDRKAELLLLFSDKRLSAGMELISRGNVDLGYSTFEKAENYLVEAMYKEEQNRLKGVETSVFLKRLSAASLRHFEVLEEIKNELPDNVRPNISRLQKNSLQVYETTRNALFSKGLNPVDNPFDCS